MITFSEIPGVEIPIFLLLFMGFTVGIVGGFMGVGGGFLITPALVVLGFPANMAVGTDTTQITGNSIVVTLRHSRLGNVDLKLGLIMAIGTVVGAEGGVRVIEWLEAHGIDEQVVLVASLILMTSIGFLTFRETMASRRRMKELKAAGKAIPRDEVSSGLAKKLQSIYMWPMIWLPTSRVVVSFWTVTAIGMATGFLSGFLGVGGGFIRVPAMIYLLGMPSLVAVGTDLFSIMVRRLRHRSPRHGRKRSAAGRVHHDLWRRHGFPNRLAGDRIRARAGDSAPPCRRRGLRCCGRRDQAGRRAHGRERSAARHRVENHHVWRHGYSRITNHGPGGRWSCVAKERHGTGLG